MVPDNGLGIKMCLHIQKSRLRTIVGPVEHSGKHIFAYKDQTYTFLGVLGFEEILLKSTFFALYGVLPIVLTYNYQIMIPLDA